MLKGRMLVLIVLCCLCVRISPLNLKPVRCYTYINPMQQWLCFLRCSFVLCTYVSEIVHAFHAVGLEILELHYTPNQQLLYQWHKRLNMLNTILQILKNFVVKLDLIMGNVEFNTFSHTRKKKIRSPHSSIINIMEHFSCNVLFKIPQH